MRMKLKPRDPERIERIVTLLGQVWTLLPDQRLGQLISNLKGLGPQNVFYMEDDEWEERLRKVLANGGQGND